MSNNNLPLPWNDTKSPLDSAIPFSNKPDAKNIRVAPLQPSATQAKVDKLNSRILNKYANVSYIGMGDSGDAEILATIKGDVMNERLSHSKFYSNVDDGEKSNRANVERVTLENPRFLTSAKNEVELNKNLYDPNGLTKEVMVDGGYAEFDYNQTAPDQISLVKEANQSFAERRDRFFIPPQAVGKSGLGDDNPDKEPSLEEFLKSPHLVNLAKNHKQQSETHIPEPEDTESTGGM